MTVDKTIISDYLAYVAAFIVAVICFAVLWGLLHPKKETEQEGETPKQG